MSSPSPVPLPVILSPDARADFEDVQLRGVQIWGRQQAEAYRDALVAALERIGQFPNIGRTVDRVAPGLRSLVIREHVVYYEVREEEVFVARIMHRRQDAAGWIGNRAP